MSYQDFIASKLHEGANHGFEPLFMPSKLFGFQESMTAWAIEKGRGALFEDCGLGKTAQELTWAENVHRHTNKPVLILTPLAVAQQTIQEAEKFDIPATRSNDGRSSGVTVTNYEKLHLFDPADFSGVVCDESSILKNFAGARKAAITHFMRKVPYRLLATATAAPNDYIELGTSSEALGYLGYMDMLNRFFKNDQNNSASGRMYGEKIKWRFRGHSEVPFWRWVCSWARAIRKPSDIGFEDSDFILPKLIERQHTVESHSPADGMLFALPAVGLKEQREERRRTITERCEKVSTIVDHDQPALVWCHLNDESAKLVEMIPDAVGVSGSDSDESKEDKFLGFASGDIRVLVTKPKIGAWGLNFQHCAHVTFFPSHSYEQYYQGVRRCWRFGQKRDVVVDVVTTEGEKEVLKNLQRKSLAADSMFARLVDEMNNATSINGRTEYTQKIEVPSWL